MKENSAIELKMEPQFNEKTLFFNHQQILYLYLNKPLEYYYYLSESYMQL